MFKFDATSDSITLATSITTPDIRVKRAALADDYIIGASDDKKIHVWKRSNCEKIHVLCDVEDEDEEYDITYPVSIVSCCGHILVSTSHIGCALCVWNMKTGKLLKHYNNAADEAMLI